MVEILKSEKKGGYNREGKIEEERKERTEWAIIHCLLHASLDEARLVLHVMCTAACSTRKF
jgi:hypothetical protein